MDVVRRLFDPAAELRALQDLSHRVWSHDARLLNFETSFGTLAWERGGTGRARAFELDGELVGWARLAPGYSRIRAAGVRDEAPPSLVWQVDVTAPRRADVLTAVLAWVEGRAAERFTTSHNEADDVAADLLHRRGYLPDPTEPFSSYLQQPRTDLVEPTLAGYRFVTMAELADVDLRAEAHRSAWEGSSRSGDDVRATMATWPYRRDLDLVALADDGSPAASVICWFDTAYRYGELEPVGTAPAHRGRGVGAALLRVALARLRRAGAAFALVGARADPDYPVPRRLYRSVGFDEVARQVVLRSPGP